MKPKNHTDSFLVSDFSYIIQSIYMTVSLNIKYWAVAKQLLGIYFYSKQWLVFFDIEKNEFQQHLFT